MIYESTWIEGPAFPPELGAKATNLQLLYKMQEKGGYSVPPGFVISPRLLTGLLEPMEQPTLSAVEQVSHWQRQLGKNEITPAARAALLSDFAKLRQRARGAPVVVRSSFLGEDEPTNSYAGVFESVLGVSELHELEPAVLSVLESVLSPRSIARMTWSPGETTLPRMSVIVQSWVGGPGWQGGVMLTTAPDLGLDDVLFISSAQHSVEVTNGANRCPEEFFLSKRAAKEGRDPVIQSTAGTHTSESRFSLSPTQLRRCVDTGVFLENRFGQPLDIEWVISPGCELYLLQARPIPMPPPCSDAQMTTAAIQAACVVGAAVGTGQVSGPARVVDSVEEGNRLSPGEILVAAQTDPHWDPLLTNARALVTEDGGRGSHAALLAREQGMLAVVGADGAVSRLTSGERITIVCQEGLEGAVYRGAPPVPERLYATSTAELTVTNPNQAVSTRRRAVSAERVSLHLSAWITRFWPTTTAARARTAYSQGYGSYERFLAARLADGISLVSAAYPDASLSLVGIARETETYEDLPTVLQLATSICEERGVSFTHS